MMAILGRLFGWLTGGTLDRILSSVDHRIDNETRREEVKADLAAEYLRAQVAVQTGRGWWFPLFFIVPLGIWFASVCLYSVLFCARCVFPQPWSIAALPAPLDEWAGVIVGSLFLAKTGEAIMARLRK